jgi:hypothetical protein
MCITLKTLPPSTHSLLIFRDDWSKFTDYRGYDKEDQVISWFWQILRSWPPEQKARLLQFTTGTSRIPVNGFKDLQGSDGPRRFTIEKYGDSSKLPRSHTCFNRLDLPPYEDIKTLEDKLRLAIEYVPLAFSFCTHFLTFSFIGKQKVSDKSKGEGLKIFTLIVKIVHSTQTMFLFLPLSDLEFKISRISLSSSYIIIRFSALITRLASFFLYLLIHIRMPLHSHSHLPCHLTFVSSTSCHSFLFSPSLSVFFWLPRLYATTYLSLLSYQYCNRVFYCFYNLLLYSYIMFCKFS